MPDSYKWIEGNETDDSLMADTTAFDDVAEDDETTDEEVATPLAVANPGVDMTGAIFFDEPMHVTEWRLTTKFYLPTGGDSGSAQSCTYLVQRRSGGIWTTLDTGPIGGPGGTIGYWETHFDTVDVEADALRAYVAGSITTPSPHNLGIGISDFRYTGTAVECNPPDAPILTGAIGLSPTRNILTIN